METKRLLLSGLNALYTHVNAYTFLAMLHADMNEVNRKWTS